MRLLFITVFLLANATVARAQEQEGKLVDRLLKPDTALANRAQGKQFAGGREAITKRAKVTPYAFDNRVQVREFPGARGLSTETYPARRFGPGGGVADVSTRSGYDKRMTAFGTQNASLVRAARDGNRTVSTAGFAQTRPFLEHGKSQKALSAKDTPLTIEQVRELLNRNK